MHTLLERLEPIYADYRFGKAVILTRPTRDDRNKVLDVVELRRVAQSHASHELMQYSGNIFITTRRNLQYDLSYQLGVIEHNCFFKKVVKSLPETDKNAYARDHLTNSQSARYGQDADALFGASHLAYRIPKAPLSQAVRAAIAGAAITAVVALCSENKLDKVAYGLGVSAAASAIVGVSAHCRSVAAHRRARRLEFIFSEFDL